MSEQKFDVVALGELLIDFAPVSTDESGYPTIKAQPQNAVSWLVETLKTALTGDYGLTSVTAPIPLPHPALPETAAESGASSNRRAATAGSASSESNLSPCEED